MQRIASAPKILPGAEPILLTHAASRLRWLVPSEKHNNISASSPSLAFPQLPPPPPDRRKAISCFSPPRFPQPQPLPWTPPDYQTVEVLPVDKGWGHWTPVSMSSHGQRRAPPCLPAAFTEGSKTALTRMSCLQQERAG